MIERRVCFGRSGQARTRRGSTASRWTRTRSTNGPFRAPSRRSRRSGGVVEQAGRRDAEEPHQRALVGDADRPVPYSIAGYLGPGAAASRSSARPRGQPAPSRCRGSVWRNAPAGSGAVTARSAAAGSVVSPRQRGAQQDQQPVGKPRLHDRALAAQSSTIASRVAATSGVPGVPRSAPWSAPRGTAATCEQHLGSCASPADREHPVVRAAPELRRGHASVSPCPAASRSRAYAIATWYEVPHPTTRPRSPAPATRPARPPSMPRRRSAGRCARCRLARDLGCGITHGCASYCSIFALFYDRTSNNAQRACTVSSGERSGGPMSARALERAAGDGGPGR